MQKVVLSLRVDTWDVQIIGPLKMLLMYQTSESLSFILWSDMSYQGIQSTFQFLFPGTDKQDDINIVD